VVPSARTIGSGAIPDQAPEIWAGVECSVVRVGDRIVDELKLTGHARRPGDLRRLAELGVRTVRYPALWERHPDAAQGRFDWRGTDARLSVMRALGMEPVLGLLHQGTGRRGELLDPEFPRAFAAYARAVAERYPWVRAFLPINEALTTARFAGLYGHWFPHRRDDAAFVTLVVNQVRAYRAAARAIREVRPDAVIVATEDVGETLSTPELAGQARFDRTRRWLALDAMTGRLDREHPMRAYLVRGGAKARDLDLLARDPEPPDLLGIHHYPTSDRFLDHRLARYPEWTHGGNRQRAYADVELLRVLGHERDGLREAALAAWTRYRLPMALTEVHIGGPIADRRAWWWDAVHTADRLVSGGVDLRAVTAWSAFGSWEWPSLLTRVEGHYEPGLFDTRRRPPRATLLASDVAAAVAGNRRMPRQVGWWRRPTRVLYPPVALRGLDVDVETAADRPTRERPSAIA
jgi:dTDP-4-dehydrorhamnose reductase